MKPLFCNECGIELDQIDVDNNLATWEVFKKVCTDCIPSVDGVKNKNYSVTVSKGITV